MSRIVQVKELLNDSEARTGNSVEFFVGRSGNKVGYVLITVLDSDLEVDVEGGLTRDKEKLILDWFEPLAKAHPSRLSRLGKGHP